MNTPEVLFNTSVLCSLLHPFQLLAVPGTPVLSSDGFVTSSTELFHPNTVILGTLLLPHVPRTPVGHIPQQGPLTHTRVIRPPPPARPPSQHAQEKCFPPKCLPLKLSERITVIKFNWFTSAFKERQARKGGCKISPCDTAGRCRC